MSPSLVRPIDRASPSLVEALRECGLKVAFRRTGSRGGSPSNPWARLGTICHKILELAALGELGQGTEDFDRRFALAWEEAVSVEVKDSRRHAEEFAWGPPKTWPSYADKRARVRRRSRELALDVAAWSDSDILVEPALEPPDDVLFGRPDLVVRRPLPHRVIDYKTGAISEPSGEGDVELKGAYRRQLLLYAFLEWRVTGGSLPTQVVVVPLRGEPITVLVDPLEVERVAAEARELVQAFNERLSDPESLARPAPSVCGRCQWAPRCPAFLRAVDMTWAPELVVVSGFALSVATATDGGISVLLSVDAGSLPREDVYLKRFPPARHPELQQVSAGSRVTVVGGRLVQDGTPTIWPSGWTRIAIAPQDSTQSQQCSI